MKLFIDLSIYCFKEWPKMITIKELQDCLQKYTSLNISQAEIARALGTSRSNISLRIKNKSQLTLSEARKIVTNLQINGAHDILNKILAAKDRLIKDDITMPAEIEEKEELVDMAYYEDVYGSCGLGSFVFSESKQIIQVPKKIVLDYSGFKKYSVINASGDSMQPQIKDKDRLIVEHWNGEQITDNRVYIFRFKDQIFIKRLVLNLDQIVVKSDNKEYQTRYIEAPQADDFQIIGKIVGLMRMEV